MMKFLYGDGTFSLEARRAAGYSAHAGAGLGEVLADLPIELVGRLRSDRVMLRDAGPRRTTVRGGQLPQARRRPHPLRFELLAHP